MYRGVTYRHTSKYSDTIKKSRYSNRDSAALAGKNLVQLGRLWLGRCTLVTDGRRNPSGRWYNFVNAACMHELIGLVIERRETHLQAASAPNPNRWSPTAACRRRRGRKESNADAFACCCGRLGFLFSQRSAATSTVHHHFDFRRQRTWFPCFGKEAQKSNSTSS